MQIDGVVGGEAFCFCFLPRGLGCNLAGP